PPARAESSACPVRRPHILMSSAMRVPLPRKNGHVEDGEAAGNKSTARRFSQRHKARLSMLRETDTDTSPDRAAQALAAAQSANLVYCSDAEPGITRRRAG